MKQYVVDAFTDKVFSGNPAAVCVLDEPISEELMMPILGIVRAKDFDDAVEKAVWLEHGNVKMFGECKEVAEIYRTAY